MKTEPLQQEIDHLKNRRIDPIVMLGKKCGPRRGPTATVVYPASLFESHRASLNRVGTMFCRPGSSREPTVAFRMALNKKDASLSCLGSEVNVHVVTGRLPNCLRAKAEQHAPELTCRTLLVYTNRKTSNIDASHRRDP
jgi:hypothetical protein